MYSYIFVLIRGFTLLEDNFWILIHFKFN